MAWLDGGRLCAASVGKHVSLVLFPCRLGDSSMRWKTIHDQLVHLDSSSATIYGYVVVQESSAGVWTLAAGDHGQLFPNRFRDPESWLRAISVCSGMGGGILGLEEAGFRCLSACDESALAVESLKRNFEFPAIHGLVGDLEAQVAVYHMTEIVSQHPEHFSRRYHPREAGLLKDSYDDMRGALRRILGQIASPWQAFWIGAHLKGAIDLQLERKEIN